MHLTQFCKKIAKGFGNPADTHSTERAKATASSPLGIDRGTQVTKEQARKAFTFQPYNGDQLIRIAASLKGIRLNAPKVAFWPHDYMNGEK